PISPTTTTPELHDALAGLGARLILSALAGDPAPEPQPAEGVTYAPKLTKEDGRLDWAQPAEALGRRIRALNPWPGTFFMLKGEAIRVSAAAPEAGEGTPGEALDDAGLIACGQGALRLQRLQRPGRAAMAAEAFLRGLPISAGTRLE
ncbi:MAG: methionyl-tRNA formyltransferase, partial [Alphaproteobacteria bacterium]